MCIMLSFPLVEKQESLASQKKSAYLTVQKAMICNI